MNEEQELQEMQEMQMEKYVTFMSNNEYFGLKIDYVNEIIVLQDITVVPESEDYIKGLINLRGKIIPVLDVRLRFHQEPFEYTDRTCIVVVHVHSTTVGLIVERIAEVVEIPEKNILPPPKIGNGEKSHDRYVYAIGKVGDKVELLLDPDKLLNEEDLAGLDQTDEEKKEKKEEKEGE